jgi:hypothetical protein
VIFCCAVFLMVITFNLLVLCQHQAIVSCGAAADCPRSGSIQPFYAQVSSDAETCGTLAELPALFTTRQ